MDDEDGPTSEWSAAMDAVHEEVGLKPWPRWL